MCLGTPGKIISLFDEDGYKMGKVDYNGAQRDICLIAVPAAQIGDFVIVHAGFALAIIDEKEARETLDALNEVNENLF